MSQGKPFLLFDLGGVLIELAGVQKMLNWMGNLKDEKEMWRMWVESPSIRGFESGKLSDEVFSRGVVKEFSLDITPEEFLREFILFPKGLYSGAGDLLESLAAKYPIGCLSNTNKYHWDRFIREDALDKYFEHQFLSFRIGHMKPDKEIYTHVLEALPWSPEEILFFDDNQMNVDMALSLGMKAHQVKGLDGLKSKLSELGL